MSDRFVLSAALVDRLRRSETRATVALQVAAAIPNPDLQTMAVPPGAAHLLEYSVEVVRDGVVGYWRLGDTAASVALTGFLVPVYYATKFYGYILNVAAPLVYERPGAIAAALDARLNPAVGVEAGGGLGVMYFPLAGLEPYFPGTFTFDAAQDFTWELWVRTTQAPAGPVRILEQESGGVFPFRLQLLPSGLLRASRSDGAHTPTLDSTQAVNDGAWRYVTYSKSGGTLSLQVDRNAAAATPDTVTGDTSLTVDGAIAGDGYEGDLDELAIYRSALGDPAKLRHWNAAKGIPA